MNVHVLTPCIRLQWLGLVASSVAAAVGRAPQVEVTWHVTVDLERDHANGWRLRNQWLDGIRDGWVFLLDDDTTMHPDLLKRAFEYDESRGDVDAIVVSQSRPDGWHSGAAIPERMSGGLDQASIPSDACLFDTGNMIARRSFYGDYRFRLERAADGHLFEDLVRGAPGVVYLDEVLSHYNALRPGEWGS